MTGKPSSVTPEWELPNQTLISCIFFFSRCDIYFFTFCRRKKMSFHIKQFSYSSVRAEISGNQHWSSTTVPTESHARPGSHTAASRTPLTQQITFALICIINWISQNWKKGKANFVQYRTWLPGRNYTLEWLFPWRLYSQHQTTVRLRNGERCYWPIALSENTYNSYNRAIIVFARTARKPQRELVT